MRRFLTIWDEYGTPWNIDNGDSIFAEAENAIKANNGEKVIWPISKLVQGRGWGWWSVYKRIADFEQELTKLMPNPGNYRLIDLDKTYTTAELRDMLQRFGSYLSTLHHMEGLVESRCHALKEGLKTGLQVAMSQHEAKASSVAEKEGQVMFGSETLKQARRMQIDEEACLAIVKGWRQSYDQAWNTVSRLITLEIGEASLATGRHN